MKNNKWLLAIAVILLVLILTNPGLKDFHEFKGDNEGRKTHNFLIFSTFQDRYGDNYIGLFLNFMKELPKKEPPYHPIAIDSTTAAPSLITDSTTSAGLPIFSKTDKEVADTALQQLYDKLHSAELYSKSFNEFRKQFSTTDRIDRLYNRLHEANLYTKSKHEFYKEYFQEYLIPPFLRKRKTIEPGSESRTPN